MVSHATPLLSDMHGNIIKELCGLADMFVAFGDSRFNENVTFSRAQAARQGLEAAGDVSRLVGTAVLRTLYIRPTDSYPKTNHRTPQQAPSSNPQKNSSHHNSRTKRTRDRRTRRSTTRLRSRTKRTSRSSRSASSTSCPRSMSSSSGAMISFPPMMIRL